MRKLEYFATFIQVVKEGSFAKAANKLNLTSAAVGKQIKVLEERLGHQLIHRMSSGISLTEAGEVFLEHALLVAEQCEDAVSALQSMSGEPKGLLRIASNFVFGHRVLMPAIPEFSEQYSELEIDIMLTDLYPNLEKESIDVLFDFSINENITALNISDLVCKRIGATKCVFCAAPSYLDKYDEPKMPSDILQHRYVTHSGRSPANVLNFKGHDPITVKPYMSADSSFALATLATSGVGIILIEQTEVAAKLKSGELIELYSEFNDYELMVGAYYRKTSHSVPKIQAIINHMIKVYNQTAAGDGD